MRNESWEVIINKIQEFEIRKGITSFVNPYSMLLVKDNEEVASQVDNWYVDGISLVKLMAMLFNKRIKRYSFDDTSVAPIVFNTVAKNNQRLAIIGTQPDIIVQSVKSIENRYGVTVNYFRDGFFANEAEIQQTIKEIIEHNIEVVVCGMGTPKQEELLIKLKNAGWGGYSYTCGGYLHQIVRKPNDYYPVLFNKLHIRWVYRIIDEPKLITRYFVKYPQFLNKLVIYRMKIKKI